MMGKIKDLTGKRYGRLTVLNLASIDSKGRTRWLCKCDCGNLKDVLSGSLISGNVRSCGCYRKELIGVQGTKRKKNLVGQKFGKLTVLSDTGRRCGSNVVWHCQCECGRFNEVQGWCLQDGSVTTCGDCQLVSRGEEKIIELLNEHRIPYEHDTSILGFRFPDSGRLARFDFYIDNRYIVEYDGIQHFKQTQGNWGKLDTLEKRQNRDMYKDKFCFENDIPIIRIPYTHLNKLCLEDLLPETSPFFNAKKTMRGEENMAKKNTSTEIYDIPATLQEHPFYGLRLDEYQKVFRDAIWDTEKLIVFCNAKAGTGKTLIATATANLLYQYGRCNGIVYIASPTQEQKQGYLKGTIEEKSEPYFEPFYEALEKIGVNRNTAFYDGAVNEKYQTAYIQCATHTFLRGTNFENKVVIIDEAQNYYFDELKKVLTRLHDSCKIIVIGHEGQNDLFDHPERSGFVPYLNWFAGDDRTAVCRLVENHRGWISQHADELTFRAAMNLVEDQ